MTTQPAQLAIPPPSANYAPTHSTTTSTTALKPGPTTLNLGPIKPNSNTNRIPVHEPPSLAQPGYTQDPYAAEMSSAQRASLEHQRDRERLENRRASLVATVLGEEAEQKVGEAVGGAWGAVKGFVGPFAAKAAEAEDSLWRRIGGGS